MSNHDQSADAANKALLKMAQLFKSLFMKNGGRNRIDLNTREADDFYYRLGDVTKEQQMLLDKMDPKKEPLKCLALETRMGAIEAVRSQFSQENREQLVNSPIEFSPEAFVDRVNDEMKQRIEMLKTHSELAGSDIEALRQEVSELNNIDGDIISKHLDFTKAHHRDLITGINATTEHVAKQVQEIESPAHAAGKDSELRKNGQVIKPNDEPENTPKPGHDRKRDPDSPSLG